MNQLLYEGKHHGVKAMTEQALADGVPVEQILEDGLIAGMKAGMAVLKPLLTKSDSITHAGTLVMGTVKGDLHDIGKNLVCMMAEGAGFRVVNLGVDQNADAFMKAVREHNADILGLSALLTTTMVYMKTVVDALQREGLTHVKVCVGGAPVSQMFADEIGADGYAPDASSAVELFKLAGFGSGGADGVIESESRVSLASHS